MAAANPPIATSRRKRTLWRSLLLLLANTFRDPYHIADFLFLETDIGVENSIVELLLEGKLVKMNLM